MKITDAFMTPKTVLKSKPLQVEKKESRPVERDSAADCMCIDDDIPASKSPPCTIQNKVHPKSELSAKLFVTPQHSKERHEGSEVSKTRIGVCLAKDPIMDLTLCEPESSHSTASSELKRPKEIGTSVSDNKKRCTDESLDNVPEFDFTLPCSPPRQFRNADTQQTAESNVAHGASSSRRTGRALSLQPRFTHSTRDRRFSWSTGGAQVESDHSLSGIPTTSEVTNDSTSIRGSWIDHMNESELVNFSSDDEGEGDTEIFIQIH